VSTAAQAQAGRDRARESRLTAARERRLRLDPDKLAREKRIDEATVDVELAWEARADAARAVESAEVTAAAAVERLLGERLSLAGRGKAGPADRAATPAGQGRPRGSRHVTRARCGGGLSRG